MKKLSILVVVVLTLMMLGSLVVVLPRPAAAAVNDLPPRDQTLRPASQAISLTTVQIQDTLLVSEVKRLGINVGSRSWYGAAQFLKNVADNPGFEAGVYGSVVHVAEGSDGQRIVQDFWEPAWNNDQYGIGQQAGFWNGADYEFVYGPAKGRHGTITNFTHEINAPTETVSRNVFYLDQNGAVPNQWDVMFVRQELPGMAGVTEWAVPDTTTTRPGSPGKQSLHLLYPDEAWQSPYHFYMDSYWRDGDQTAGKLIIIEGNWRLEFWARGGRDGDQLQAAFFREGEPDFFNQVITLTTQWQPYTFDFNVPAGADRPTSAYGPGDYHPLVGFTLNFLYNEEGDEAWIDDLALYNADDANPTVFTDAYVNLLKELRPGILRDWSNQFGSTLDIQLAEPWARQTQGYRPHERSADSYSYSLHEFLELCVEVGAEPWYVIPPTFTAEELDGLAEYLAAPADGAHPYADHRSALGQTAPWTEVFPVIHLEFGNELWGAASGGDPFMGASLLGGERLGQIANDRFVVLKSSPYYDAGRMDLIIGGQAGWPGQNYNIQNNSTAHDTIALAPYFGVLEARATDEEIFYPLFARAFDDVIAGRVKQCRDEIVNGGGQDTRLAVYELNFHTTDPGDGAPLALRNDYVAGAGGALALPLSMLSYLRDLQIRDQCAFSSLQYSFGMSNGEYIKLWGMLRDVAATARKRPTWLGVELANRAIQGDMLATVQGGDNPGWRQAAINGVEHEMDVAYVQSFAFRDGERTSVILFNLNLDEAQRVRLALPAPPKRTATLYQIAPADIYADNEVTEEVTIQTQTLTNFSDAYVLDLPPHSVTALTWERALLELTGVAGDRQIGLSWTVNTTLPPDAVWRITYYTQTSAILPVVTDIVSPTRAYTLTGLTNYVWYTVTLNAMVDAAPILTDTVRLMPASRDHLLYLPLVMRN
ncbi:MAG: hypothetical protein JXA21_20845 [Anaerolineae bacterium]|nr:hypothetical protein [Anaerolineae bacterium]